MLDVGPTALHSIARSPEERQSTAALRREAAHPEPATAKLDHSQALILDTLGPGGRRKVPRTESLNCKKTFRRSRCVVARMLTGPLKFLTQVSIGFSDGPTLSHRNGCLDEARQVGW